MAPTSSNKPIMSTTQRTSLLVVPKTNLTLTKHAPCLDRASKLQQATLALNMLVAKYYNCKGIEHYTSSYPKSKKADLKKIKEDKGELGSKVETKVEKEMP